MRIYKPFLFGMMALGLAGSGLAQSWDNSGDGLLKGTYYFRHVLWFCCSDVYGDFYDALTFYNTISFDGSGHYTISGATIYDAYQNATGTLNLTGTYTISASGYGFLDSPASQLIGEELGVTLATPDQIYGLVSNGIFIGSATENIYGYNDLFVAAPAGNASASTFSGQYALAGMDSPGFGITEGIAYSLDYLIVGNADGKGNFNVSSAKGYIGANGGSATSQDIGDAKYIFSNGAANLNLNGNINNLGSSDLVTGQHYLYITPDGNFVFGGEPYGWDFFVGTRIGSSTKYNGLYYQAGMDMALSASQGQNIAGAQDSYISSFKAQSVADQRLNTQANADSSGNVIPYDFTFIDDVALQGNSGDDGAQHYVFSSDGKYRVGIGNFPGLGLSIALAGPTFQGAGLALDPTGLVNTGSNAPFTSHIVPGQLLTIYGQSGSTLASGSATSTNLNLPTTLDNTQVLVNGVKAPVLAVNECGPYPCVTFVVPYETASPGIASIQLVNQGKTSNTISALVGYSAPGLFTLPQLGAGSFNMYYAAAIHANGQIVSPANPARPTETIAVFLTGIGGVSPSVLDGAPGPVNPTAGPVNPLTVYLSSTSANGASGVQATTQYVGLAPEEVAGLAQINLTIPSGVTSGDNVLEISGADADTIMALISIGSSSTASAVPAARPARRAAKLHQTKIRQAHVIDLSR